MDNILNNFVQISAQYHQLFIQLLLTGENKTKIFSPERESDFVYTPTGNIEITQHGDSSVNVNGSCLNVRVDGFNFTPGVTIVYVPFDEDAAFIGTFSGAVDSKGVKIFTIANKYLFSKPMETNEDEQKYTAVEGQVN